MFEGVNIVWFGPGRDVRHGRLRHQGGRRHGRHVARQVRRRGRRRLPQGISLSYNRYIIDRATHPHRIVHLKKVYSAKKTEQNNELDKLSPTSPTPT